jgi:hypothetical protein
MAASAVQLLRSLRKGQQQPPPPTDERRPLAGGGDEGLSDSEEGGADWKWTNARGIATAAPVRSSDESATKVVRPTPAAKLATRAAWIVGDRVDVDTEDGMELGAVVLGPSRCGDPLQLRVRFRDGVEDDWDVGGFRRPTAGGAGQDGADDDRMMRAAGLESGPASVRNSGRRRLSFPFCCFACCWGRSQ